MYRNLFFMDINKYRNCINILINWEWNILKRLRKKLRRNILLRGSFLILSLASIVFCIFAPSFILGSLLTAFRVPNSIVEWARIIFLIVWLWFISPIDNLSKQERDAKNKRKVEVIKAIEKAREAYGSKFK